MRKLTKQRESLENNENAYEAMRKLTKSWTNKAHKSTGKTKIKEKKVYINEEKTKRKTKINSYKKKSNRSKLREIHKITRGSTQK